MSWSFLRALAVGAVVLAPAGAVRADTGVMQMLNQVRGAAKSTNKTIQQGKSTLDQIMRDTKSAGQKATDQANKAAAETKNGANQASSSAKQKANEGTENATQHAQKAFDEAKAAIQQLSR